MDGRLRPSFTKRWKSVQIVSFVGTRTMRHGLRSSLNQRVNDSSMTRREALVTLAMVGLECAVLPARSLDNPDATGGWKKYTGNPVLGGQYGTCFDICVLREQGLYRMWLSWRPKSSVALTESKDGIHWGAPKIVLPPEPATGWEDDINRPVIVHREDGYHMWYTGQASGKSKIGYAKSGTGREWVRQSSKPVLESTLPWEGAAVMCPHVMWDEHESRWKLWYSGGEQYEPNAIGYATSTDGLHWDKYPANPVLSPVPGTEWEKERIGDRFLRYTIESILDEQWKTALCPVHTKIHVDGTSFGHALDGVFERLLEIRRFA